MKQFYAIACATFCCLATGYTGEETEEISVVLGSEHALLPTLIETIEQADGSFSANYLTNIRNVLSFDMNNNGMTRSMSGQEYEKAQASVGIPSFDGTLDLGKLREHTVSYLVRWRLKEKVLETKIAHITSGVVRAISPITLSGELSQDRRKIHQLADCIHLMLFGKPGIASSKIVYIVKKHLPSQKNEPIYLSEVVQSDYDGANAHPITNTNSLCVTPVVAPQKTKGVQGSLLYVSYELGQPKIFARSSRDGHIYRVTLMRGNQLTPAISHDGSLIAFCSDITGTADLYIASFEEDLGAVSKPRQIFHAKGSATACPTFSPDGKKVAFVSNKDGSAKIYIMDIPAPGTKIADLKPRLISKRCKDNTAPAWSPDGKKIAYSAKNSGDRQIWIYDLDRATEEQLTDGPGGKESPAWASDSLHILFHGYPSGTGEIYLVNLNQPKAIKITSGPGEKQFPCWASVE